MFFLLLFFLGRGSIWIFFLWFSILDFIVVAFVFYFVCFVLFFICFFLYLFVILFFIVFFVLLFVCLFVCFFFFFFFFVIRGLGAPHLNNQFHSRDKNYDPRFKTNFKVHVFAKFLCQCLDSWAS